MLWPLPNRMALACAAWLAAALPLLAASPTLTRLVPADAGLCLMVENAAPHVDRFRAGSLYARWRKFPPLEKWTHENRPALERIVDDVGQQLGVEVDDVWRGIFGRQTVLAIWPPATDQKHGPGLLLVEASDAALLETLVAGVRDVQERSGELLDSRRVMYRGLTYEERLIWRDGGKVRVCLAVLDRVGVLTSHAETLERVLDLHLAAGRPGASLAQSTAFLEAQAQVDSSAPLKLFINPRTWDAALARGLSEKGERARRGQQLLVEAWHSLQYAAFSMRLEPQPRLEGFLARDPARQATEIPEVLGALTGSPSLLKHVPADCLAAAAGVVDVDRLVRWLRSPAADVQAAPRRRSAPEVVWSMLDGTFLGIGPSVSGFVAAAPRESEFPFAAAAGVEVHRRAADDTSGLKPLEALRSLLEAAVDLQSRPDGRSPQVKLQKSGDVEVLTVANLPNVPGAIEPSLAFQQRAMLVGTSPRVVEQAATLERDNSLAASAVFRRLLGPRLVAPSQAAYVHLAGLRRLLAADFERIATALAPPQVEKRDASRRGLKELSTLLELADAAAVAAQIDSTGIRVTASVSIEQ
jgi:hypothetical protein